MYFCGFRMDPRMISLNCLLNVESLGKSLNENLDWPAGVSVGVCLDCY